MRKGNNLNNCLYILIFFIALNIYVLNYNWALYVDVLILINFQIWKVL